jgi:hypothetical protein
MASSPNAVNTPAARCSPTAPAVAGRLACQASRIASATSPGSRRVIAVNEVAAST